MNIPADLKYTKDHEWVKIEGDIATVGITDFAQSELGDIVYVEVETLDETLDAEEVFGTVEAVKTVSDLFLPLSGEIIAFNEELEDSPSKSPTGRRRAAPGTPRPGAAQARHGSRPPSALPSHAAP